MISDQWENEGVHYTIDPAKGTGAIITAQRQTEIMIYSRIVSGQLTRGEVEQLFEAQLEKSF